MLKTASYLFPLKYLLKRSRVKVFLPYYHVVSDKNIEHIFHLYKYRNIMHFIGDIGFFKENFNFVSLQDLIDHKNGKTTLPEKAIHLTFDDGLSEVYEFVAPILNNPNIMAYKNYGLAFFFKFLKYLKAFLLKCYIPNCKHFINY